MGYGLWGGERLWVIGYGLEVREYGGQEVFV